MNIGVILKYVALVLLVGLAGFVIWLAILNGSRGAKSRQVVRDATSIAAALEYFYKDQNRYPAVNEFKDQNVMRQYLSNFPPREFASGVCDMSFEYANTFRDDYELRICLPKSVRGYRTGWNVIKSPAK